MAPQYDPEARVSLDKFIDQLPSVFNQVIPLNIFTPGKRHVKGLHPEISDFYIAYCWPSLLMQFTHYVVE